MLAIMLLDLLVPLVSDEQVSAARNKAILWTVFAVAMLAFVIYRAMMKSRSTRKDDDVPPDDQPPED